jgi:hypothetical protein
MSAISGTDRLNRTAAFCESFKVSSINLTSNKSVTVEGFDCPRRILAKGDNSFEDISFRCVIVSLIRLNVASFANLTLISANVNDCSTANNEFQK